MGQHQGQFHPQQHPLTETNLIQHSKELQKAEAILQMQHEALQSLLVSRRVALQNCTTTQEQAILMAEIQLLEFKITNIQRTRQHAYQESQVSTFVLIIFLLTAGHKRCSNAHF